MATTVLDKWLGAWGYSDAPGALHLRDTPLPADHIYRTELEGLLDPHGSVRANAVFDVDGVPTICFLEVGGEPLQAEAVLRVVRERAWNQNLVTIVLAVDDERAIAAPSALPNAKLKVLAFSEAKRFGEFSCADIQSGDVFYRHPEWFAAESRIDRDLLRNLGLVVNGLVMEGVSKFNAQMLMAQLMFVSYLEHRGIVGSEYRSTRSVGTLAGLVHAKDRPGIVSLLEHLKTDFNGDVLEPVGAKTVWSDLPDAALTLLNDFLRRVDLDSRQASFWHYDFRFIPVELISGIYESFLSTEKRDTGAYYTPRNLAVLAVDQALRNSKDVLKEKIYDGACGSGILLTTAFRRLLVHGEAASKRQWSFTERVALLEASIFGSDINKAACRVTAFSLYLSVLENLRPADIAKLTEKGKSRLPKLAGNNIFAEEEGDFFSDRNKLATCKSFTLFLSNPPWVEPDSSLELSSDRWAAKHGYSIPRRNTCAAFMLRALDAVDPKDGRFCYILPVSVLGAATSQRFVNMLLDRCTIDSVINFGDLRKVLFDDAKQPTLVVTARPRNQDSLPSQPELIEYWTPKADVSFAFGRLTLHGSDRNIVQSSQLRTDNSILTTLFWGTPHDLALISSLQMKGKIEDVLNRTGWNTSKGFHKKDSHVDQKDLVPVTPIKHLKYLNARRFAMDGPLLDDGVLEKFPEDISEVPNLSESLIARFYGPRILFKDGMTPDRGVCAVFSSKAMCFNSSTAAITAPKREEDVLRFLAVYLHSDLVRYVLLLNAYQISFERERVTLHDIKRLPFIHPMDHAMPKRALAIVAEVAAFVRKMEDAPQLRRRGMYENWKDKAEALFAEYYGLSPLDQARIKEVIDLVLPSLQPSSLANLATPLQQRVTGDNLQSYVSTLLQELAQWRDATGGEGEFGAQLTIGSAQSCGALGILRIDIVPTRAKRVQINQNVADDAVSALVQHMQRNGVLPARLDGNLYIAADVVVRHEDSLYLVKPLVKRLWLLAEAVRDAERIVRYVQGTPNS